MEKVINNLYSRVYNSECKLSYLMSQCSQLAYLDGKEAKQEYKNLGFEKHKFFENKGAQCHAVYTDDWLVLAFRGTEVKEWSDIKADLSVDSTSTICAKGKVMVGFNTEVKKLWRQLTSYISEVKKDRNLIITGHSLGGAMATIMAANLQASIWEVFRLYTYGSPRVGNQTFCDNVNVVHYRYVNNTDDVTKIPFRHWGYRHHGNLKYINSMGQVQTTTTLWSRFVDRIKGRWYALTRDNIIFDGLADHSIEEYKFHLNRIFLDEFI